MVAKGSGGERYNLDGKGKRKFGSFEDYPVLGAGGYCARIFTRGRRNAAVEAQVREAVYSGDAIDGERPLNALYLNGKFAGFLFEGMAGGSLGAEPDAFSGGSLTGRGPAQAPEDHPLEGGRGRAAGEGAGQMAVIGVQLAVAAVMALLGLKLMYPFYLSKISTVGLNGFAAALTALNDGGVPAILAGMALQVFSFFKWRDAVSHPGIGAAAAVVSNLTGMAVWTFAVLILVFLVQGVINFLARYLVSIILILVLFSWLKKNFRRFF